MKSPVFYLKKRLKQWERQVFITKRQQFVIATAMLTAGLILTQLTPEEFRYPMAIGLSFVAYIMSAIVLREDMHGVEWFTLLILPCLFTAGMTLFYFLLPARWLTRLPVALLYAVGVYALLLTENIYNVAANRTIALLRAAHSVGFLLTLVSFFLLTQALLAFRLPVGLQVLGFVVIALPLAIQSLWGMELSQTLSRRVWHIAVVLTLAMSQLVWIFYFWPVNTTLIVLLLTTFFYSTVGIAQQYLMDRLYKKTITEFTTVSLIVFVIVLIATRWRGT